MSSKFGKVAAVLALAASFSLAALSSSAFAYTTQCWKCVGGWCCY